MTSNYIVKMSVFSELPSPENHTIHVWTTNIPGFKPLLWKQVEVITLSGIAGICAQTCTRLFSSPISSSISLTAVSITLLSSGSFLPPGKLKNDHVELHVCFISFFSFFETAMLSRCAFAILSKVIFQNPHPFNKIFRQCQPKFTHPFHSPNPALH